MNIIYGAVAVPDRRTDGRIYLGHSANLKHTDSLRYMVTSILEDQQYMFGVRSLLKVEKVLLMKNVLTMKPAISSHHLFFIRHL